MKKSAFTLPEIISGKRIKDFTENEKLLNLLKALMDYNPSVIFMKDEKGRYVYINDSYNRLFVKGKDWAGKNDFDFWSAESAELFRENDATVLKSGQVCQFTEDSIDLSGTRHCWLTYKFPFTDRKGNRYLGGIGIDITERIIAEEALKDSNEKLKRAEKELIAHQGLYEELVKNARSIIIKVDATGRFTFMNEYALDFFGFREDEIIGKTALETIVPLVESTGRKLDDLMNKLYKNPDKFSININENCRKNGERVWIEWHNKSLYDQDGRRTGHLAVGVDITESRKAKEALEESERRFRRIAERFEIAMENGKIGTWEWNIKTNEVTLDERTCKIFKMGACNLSITLEEFENVLHPDDVEQLRSCIRNSFETGKDFECVYRLKEGDQNFISSRAIVTSDPSGAYETMMGVCFDVTGMKKDADQALLRLNEELKRSNQDLQQFAYVASHDLQEPLRMVASFTQLLSQRYGDKLDEDAREYIQYAVGGAKRMYELLNGILAFSRVNTRGGSFRTTDMNEVLKKVSANLSLLIDEKGAIIRKSSLPVIIADETQMIMLLQNLIENAMKFNLERPVVTVNYNKTGGYHIISVSDNGIGIAPEYHEKIFRIFQRLHTTEYKGTGIGLAVSKKIVDRHQGRIWVESIPGRGSTFLFSIPENLRLMS